MEQKDLARFVGVLNRQSQAYISNAFKNMDISYSECIFLVNLYDNEGINQEELSTLLLTDKTITAKAIKSLEKKGFLTRKVCEKDKRAKKLYLTDRGRECKGQIFSLLGNWVNFLTDGMNRETKDIVFNGLQLIAERAAHADFNELLRPQEEESNKNIQ